MTDLPPSPEERDEDLAITAEYVLGLLEPAEVTAFEERLALDPEFRALVAAWSEDFATLLEATPAEAPPPRVEAALMRRLFPEERQSWLRRLGILPAILGGLASALLVIWVSNLGLLQPQPPAFAAAMESEDDSLVVLASVSADAAAIDVERTAGQAAEGRSLELWLIPEGEDPISLGVLPDEPVGRIAVPEALRARVVAGALLALTDEPLGGSPDGRPSGPPVAAGPVVAVDA